MSDEKTPADIELEDSLRSIHEIGEDSQGPSTTDDEVPGEQNPNPGLPDWGSDGIPAEDEPEANPE